MPNGISPDPSDSDGVSEGAPAVAILSGGAANGLVSRVEPRFFTETQHRIEGDFGAVGMMRNRILAEEPVDVIILTRALIDELVASGHVDGETVKDLGHVVTGIAVRTGEPMPDVSTPEALADTLRDATSLYVPHTTESTAGRHVASVLSKLGLSDLYGPRLRQFANGQTAMATMARAPEKRSIGCTQITEILNTEGVEYVGDLPESLGLSTIYTGAVSTTARSPDAAKALLDILADPKEDATRKAAGFL